MRESSQLDLPSLGDSQGPHGVDPLAMRRWRDRLAAAEQTPWLHAEVASRMAQRLPIIRRPPATALLWPQMGVAGVSPVQAVWPRCACWEVQEQGMRPLASQPMAWWKRCLAWLRGREPTRGATASVGEDNIAPASADMVWSNLHVHAHARPHELLQQWLTALKVEGFLMFSTWGPGSLPELRGLYGSRGFGPAMAQWVDMHDWGDLLVRVGFADPVMDQEMLTLTFSTPQAALDELRALGGNCHPLRHAGLRGRGWKQGLLADLREMGRQRADGRIALSFEVVYGHAFKPNARFPLAAETRVDVEQLRQSARSARLGSTSSHS